MFTDWFCCHHHGLKKPCWHCPPLDMTGAGPGLLCDRGMCGGCDRCQVRGLDAPEAEASDPESDFELTHEDMARAFEASPSEEGRVVAVAHQVGGVIGFVWAATPYWHVAARRSLVDGLVALHAPAPVDDPYAEVNDIEARGWGDY